MYVLLYWVSWNSSIIEHLADSNLHLYSPVMCRNELSARLFTHQTINYFTLSFASTNYWNLGSEAHAENISDKNITIYRSFSRSCKLKGRGFLCNRYSLVTRVNTFMLAQLNFHSNALPGSVFFSKISNTCQWIFIRKEWKKQNEFFRRFARKQRNYPQNHRCRMDTYYAIRKMMFFASEIWTKRSCLFLSHSVARDKRRTFSISRI